MNIIGFSNGGNASARWIVRCGQYRPFTINNFVSVSTPFNGDSKTNSPSGFLKEMIPFKSVSNNISCRHFAGIMDGTGSNAWDGVCYNVNQSTCEQVTGQPLQSFNGYNHRTALDIPVVTNLFNSFL